MNRLLMIIILLIVCFTATAAVYMNNINTVNTSTLNLQNKIETYIVKFSEATLSTVSHYAYLFNIKEEFFDDELYFVFKNEEEQLTVYKHLNQINYKRLQTKEEPLQELGAITVNNDEDAVNTAVNFLKKNRLQFSYEESLVGFDGEFYKVTLINKLSGIAMLAFNNTVILDKRGNVVNVDYFYAEFSKHGSCELLSLRDACERSGVFFTDEVLENAEVSIIYMYADSIIVPGYLIEGQLQDGSCFRKIVNAACF